MSLTIRPAGDADALSLSTLAAVTFGMACPPHTTQAAKDAFIASVLSESRFAEYLRDPARVVLVAERVGDGERAGDVDAADVADSDSADSAVADSNAAADLESAALVGYTILVFGAPTDPDVAAVVGGSGIVELSKCYVLADHHSTGLAALLMERSMRAARDRGAATVWLGVNEENARAQRFYAKHGFERVGSKHFLVGDRLEDDWIMSRAVSLPRP